jgi:hypothetical protein
MGYFAIACALFCGAVILASVWAGGILSLLGVGVYAYLDRIFGAKLKAGRDAAYHDGYERGKLDGERLKKYNESPMPKTSKEAFETKTWAEGLAALYPSDPELKKELDLLKKEKEMLDNAG